MPRNKLKKFAELEHFPNVAQESQNNCKEKLQGFLSGENKIVLELACGKGEYTLALAKMFPDKKFVGVDIQGERLWQGAGDATKNKLTNVFFLRTQVESLQNYIKNDSISEIWITFPDPFPRLGQIKKRLTSPRFLNMYKDILKKDSNINIKTDDKNYYLYSLDSLKDFGANISQKIADIYQNNGIDDILKIQTYYEKKHLANNKKIYYIKAKLT